MGTVRCFVPPTRTSFRRLHDFAALRAGSPKGCRARLLMFLCNFRSSHCTMLPAFVMQGSWSRTASFVLGRSACWFRGERITNVVVARLNSAVSEFLAEHTAVPSQPRTGKRSWPGCGTAWGTANTGSHGKVETWG